jgi:hypothetical protein
MKTPRGYGQPVLYLDYDGVLHHEDVHWHPRKGAYMHPTGFTLFEHAELLNNLLRPYPHLLIVLSTSWVRQYGCHGAAKRLPAGLRERVIGSTFHSRMNEMEFAEKPRGVQVWEDSLRRLPSQWFAIDDTAFDWPHWCRECLVHTDERLGISEPGAVEKIQAHLVRVHGG